MRKGYCKICASPQREAVEADLAAGLSVYAVAKKHGFSRRAVGTHREHMGRPLPAPAEVELPVDPEAPVLDQIRGITRILLELLSEVRGSGRTREAVSVLNTAYKYLELQAKLLGDLGHGPQTAIQVAIVQSPEWVRIREAIAKALEPYPEAREAVALALLEAERGNDA